MSERIEDAEPQAEGVIVISRGLLIGTAHGYWIVLLGIAVTSLGASLWHAPAFGTLGAMYPHRRATAMAVHRMGGSLGDSISPIIIGLLLVGVTLLGIEWSGLEWRTLALLLIAPALLSSLALADILRQS